MNTSRHTHLAFSMASPRFPQNKRPGERGGIPPSTDESPDGSYIMAAIFVCLCVWYGYESLWKTRPTALPPQLTEQERRSLREKIAMAAAVRAKKDTAAALVDEKESLVLKGQRRTVDSENKALLPPSTSKELPKKEPPKMKEAPKSSINSDPVKPSLKQPTAEKTAPVSRLILPPSEKQQSVEMRTEETQDAPQDTLPDEAPSATEAALLLATDLAVVEKKKKKQLVTVPPPQILCQALSHVLKSNVTVWASDENGTWGGKGWRKRPTAYPNACSVVLHMQKPEHLEDNEEWEALGRLLPAVLQEALSESFEVLGENVHKAVLYHTRARGVARDGYALYTPGEQAFEGVKVCMETLCRWLVEQVANWISPELKDYLDDEMSLDDGGDLFSDDYSRDENITSGSFDTISLLDSLFGLLEEPVTVVTSDFLEELFLFHATDDTQEDDKGLATVFLNLVFSRLAMANVDRSFSCPTLTRRVCAVSNLLTLSPSTCQSLTKSMQTELSLGTGKNGRELEGLIRLAPLFEAAANTVPLAGTEAQPGSTPGSFLQQLERLDGYPTCVFHPKKGSETRQLMIESRRAMKIARDAAGMVLGTLFKTSRDKGIVFQWLGRMLSSNKELVYLLKDDLLNDDGITEHSSSRAFLLGLTSTLVGFCVVSLRSRLDKMGADAFDPTYLDKSNQVEQYTLEDKNRLFQGSETIIEKETFTSSSEFAGATSFFFLSCLALRVAVHPALRMEEEFLSRYSKLLAGLQDTSEADGVMASNVLQVSKSVVAARVGWITFLEDPELSSNMTDFCLLQLGWLVAVAQKEKGGLASIPDWMCREPARWLSHLAYTAPHYLSHTQAEKAVEYATLLLEFGGSNSKQYDERSFCFSPVVLTTLIEITSAFVQAGVHRARNKQRSRGRAGAVADTQFDEPDDDRGLEVYLSFDKNDLGVIVFTNSIVREKLCPTLVRTFRAVDIVEGLDADRDADFSKFSAKSQIAELLLRLWWHPAGDCRASFATLSASEILLFASSLSSAITLDFDFASSALEKVRMSSKDHPTTPKEQQIQKSYIEQSAAQAVGMFLGTRRFLSLLCAISQHEGIAVCLGGYSQDDSLDTRQITALSNMFVHLLDSMVSDDGGTHPSLEEQGSEPTSRLLSQVASMQPSKRARAAGEAVRRRISTKMEYGLDISILCHNLLALVSKWHLSAVNATRDPLRMSPLLHSLIENEDCDVTRLERAFTRLVAVPNMTNGSEADNAHAIFEHDGYVDHTNWKHKYIDPKVSETQKRHRQTSRQDQVKHEDISKVASNDEISLFLKDLRGAVTTLKASSNETPVDASRIANMEDLLLSGGATLREDDYGEYLSDCLVSSEPFRTTDGNGFAHKYDKIARNRAMLTSGKTLVKEANKCHKGLPYPSVNASIFVCFAEERMDLCRVIVTGPVDTPYAHGLFVFDVFFPPSYPQVAPMVTFMTTGGGQVRFNPNLYVDGKVCISLLGSTNASDESQRWNPNVSSLAQVMLSIQSQILGVSDPYFNEGNGVPEMMRRTEAGRAGSMKYNTEVRLATLRYAMVQHLRYPPKGFEEVTLRHFSMCRRRILVQARRWMLEARGTSISTRFQRSYSELLSLLTADTMHLYDSLPPLSEDLEAIEKLDPSFRYISPDTASTMQTRTTCSGTATGAPDDDDDRQKPSQLDVASLDSPHAGFNPWAVPSHAAAGQRLAAGPSISRDDQGNDESDDELYS